jgi:class 3 adenylate cyclase
MNPRPTGTVTFLFTDIEGSASLWEHHSSSMSIALHQHNYLLRHTIEAHGGHVFKTVGDAFCAVFQSARAAVQAAIEAQRALVREEWGAIGPIRVRMALHTGEVEERDNDYFGPCVNRVARLLSAAHGGQVLMSAVTRALVRDLALPGISLIDLGEYRLKDLHRPEKVYQVVTPDLPTRFPPLKTLRSQPNRRSSQSGVCKAKQREATRLVEVCARVTLRWSL